MPYTRKRKAANLAEVACPVPSSMDEDVLDEYRCPITYELPVDPVIAEDGQCYERYAIEEWFQRITPSKSPMTNNPMGTNLIPATQTRSAIDRLISKGVIGGDPAKEWRAKRSELQALSPKMRDSLNRAQRGNPVSMRIVGLAYRDGSEGFSANRDKANEWWAKAAKLHDPTAVASLGNSFLCGLGVAEDQTKGVMLLARAAMLGSEHGAVCLGNYLTSGKFFTHPDLAMARWWYDQSERATVADTNKIQKDLRDKWYEANGREASSPAPSTI